MNKTIKILFFADTHLGYDEPVRPRIQRRRRGDDFFSNYMRVLNIARREKVDLILHGGDFFFRSKIPPAIIERAYQPLLDLANSGIPICIVPGNHERSRLPNHLWLTHPKVQVFDRPRTYIHQVRNLSIALSGFPFTRKVKKDFNTLLDDTGYKEIQADIHYLCTHQTFEGAVVGPVDFTFREGPDNIPGEWVPEKFTAVLSGHIHRGQRLTRNLEGQDLAVPLVYPGSIERTSFAERFEEKYYVTITLYPNQRKPRQVIQYHPLPTRPMVKLELPVEDRNITEIRYLIQDRLMLIDPDAIVRVNLVGQKGERLQEQLTAPGLRSLAPETMNISLGKDWVFQG